MTVTTKKDKIDIACNTFKNIHKSGVKKFINLDDWLEKEINIFNNETKNTIFQYLKYKRGQLIKVDFGINLGTELSHTHFAIVLNNDDTINTDNLTVLPLTSKNGYKRIKLDNIIKKEKYKNNINYRIIIQIKTISKKRILLNNIKYVCDDEVMKKINNAIKNYIIVT